MRVDPREKTRFSRQRAMSEVDENMHRSVSTRDCLLLAGVVIILCSVAASTNMDAKVVNLDWLAGRDQ